MLRKVKLHGELAEFVGHKEFDAVIRCTADAVKFLVCNFKGIEAHMNNRYYRVIINDSDVAEEELHDPIGASDINIVPVITGSGGNFGKILLGAALIGSAFAFGGLTFTGGLGKSLAAAGGFTKAAFGIGSALVLSGVSDMLFPMPKFKEYENEEDPRISFSFSGVQNTARAGTSIPLCYGEIVTGSVVISAGIDTHQIVTESE
jgi:predicted phage tail protein